MPFIIGGAQDFHSLRGHFVTQCLNGKLDRPAALMVAVHEAGHALGLAHSADSRDVMFATPRTSALSDRDRRTIELIYGLPAGSVKGGDN